MCIIVKPTYTTCRCLLNIRKVAESNGFLFFSIETGDLTNAKIYLVVVNS